MTSNYPHKLSNGHLWKLALVWIGIFVRIILTPEILYGYNFLNKPITEDTDKVVLNSVLVIKGTVMPIASEKDRKLEEKYNPY